MRLCVRRMAWAALWLLLGGAGYHMMIFHVWPWWVTKQQPPEIVSTAFSAGALYPDAKNVLDVDIQSKDPWLVIRIGAYLGSTERPRKDSEFVPNEGGPNVHSLYLIDAKTCHRITIRGVKVRLSQPGLQHLAVR